MEGIAEQVIIPALYNSEYGVSLESLGVSVVNVNGVAFKHFLRVCENGFFKKCVVLTDQDTGTKTENRAPNLKKNFENGKLIKVCVTEESTFEKDLIAANRSEVGKKIILAAIVTTRPAVTPETIVDGIHFRTYGVCERVLGNFVLLRFSGRLVDCGLHVFAP
ncbi:MAG: hypothetical protein CME32_22740 [Gimesia sp.]|nr:hypothetical protein [Gimesia sp.]